MKRTLSALLAVAVLSVNAASAGKSPTLDHLVGSAPSSYEVSAAPDAGQATNSQQTAILLESAPPTHFTAKNAKSAQS